MRAAPVPCLGRAAGGRPPAAQRAGSLTLAPDEVFLVVSGPITREHQAPDERRKFLTPGSTKASASSCTAAPPRAPLEIDALNFELGFAASGSVRLELETWLDATPERARARHRIRAAAARCSAPRSPTRGGALAAAGSLARGARARASAARSCSTTSRSSVSTRAAWRPWSGARRGTLVAPSQPPLRSLDNPTSLTPRRAAC